MHGHSNYQKVMKLVKHQVPIHHTDITTEAIAFREWEIH